MDALTNQTEPPAHRAVRLLDGPVKAARTLGVDRYQTVQSWLRTRVPAEYCPLIEEATGGAVRCEDLRPDVKWAVLRQQGDPITVPADQPEDGREPAQG